MSDTPAPTEPSTEHKWTMVALHADGWVRAGGLLGYTDEAEFRKEHERFSILIVPGPIALGEPLTSEQWNAAVIGEDAVIRERAALLARAEAAETRMRELERVLRNASATLGWYAYSGNYKTNYAPDGDPGKSDVMRDAGSRARAERTSVLAVLAQAGEAHNG